MCVLQQITGLVGAAVLLWLGFSFLSFVFAKFLRPGKDLKKAYGSWAVVTGATGEWPCGRLGRRCAAMADCVLAFDRLRSAARASSDGIGKGFVKQLAKKGMNVLLISRTASRLEDTVKEVAAKYSNVEFKTLAIDFSNFDEDARRRVADAIRGLDVGVLVNNVGMSYPFCKYFHELTDKEVHDLNELNISSTTWMTRIVLPGMLERKRGAIVNLSSTAGVVPSPLLAQYSGAKSFIAMFTRAMNVEYGSKGIHFQCQIPLFVATKLAKLRHTSFFVPSPDAYAAAAVKAIGYETITTPYWTHALQLAAVQALPSFIQGKLLLSMHHSIRSKGMKKEQQAKAVKRE